MTEERSIGMHVVSIRKNRSEELRLSFNQFNGRMLFTAWVFFESRDGEMRPGRSGISFSINRLPDFADAVSLALEKARGAGLVE